MVSPGPPDLARPTEIHTAPLLSLPVKYLDHDGKISERPASGGALRLPHIPPHPASEAGSFVVE